LKSKATITGGKELRAKLQKMAASIRGPVLGRAAMDGAFIMQREIQQKAPVDTGAYKSSIRTEAGESSATSAEATVGTNAAQAFALEFGSGLHAEKGPREKYVIEPDEKKALFWPGAAGPVFRVMHPGIEAQPHFRPGFEKAKDPAAKAVGMAIRREIDKAIS
jgi:hypothetical protein